MGNRWSDRGRRFKSFYLHQWRGGCAEFCRRLNVKQCDLEKYFLGKHDPLKIGLEKLLSIGIDIKFLVTGTHTIPMDVLITREILNEFGCGDVDSVLRLLASRHRCDKCRIDGELFTDRALRVHEMNKISNN